MEQILITDLDKDSDSGQPGENADDTDTLQFNVGGTRFETLRSTLDRPEVDCKLRDWTFLNGHYRAKYNDFYFDRDPNMFRATLNYLITGELHLPSFACGPSAKIELEFWGISPSKIERCCWMNYNDWNSTLEALQNLERDRKVTMMTRETHVDVAGESGWEKFRREMWRLLNRTNSSLLAKIFGLVALLFVSVSIFSFLAETTEQFYYSETRVNRSHDVNSTNNVTMVTTETTETTPTSPASTDEPLSTSYYEVELKHPTLYIIDLVCLSFFTLEYLTRLLFAPKKLKYVTSLLAVIDIIAILPDYFELIIYEAWPHFQENIHTVNYISTIRIIRVLRIFRLIRHVPGLWILVYTIRASVSELMLIFWFMLLGILVFSSLIYYVEDRENFKSIPHGFWWALITMTTVGYGDMYPTTILGKIIGSFCAMSGVLMIGFTVPALVNNFMLYYRHVQFAIQAEAQREHDSKKKAEDDVSGTGNVPIDDVWDVRLDGATTSGDFTEGKYRLTQVNGENPYRIQQESSPLVKQTRL